MERHRPLGHRFAEHVPHHGPQAAHVLREGRKIEVQGGIDFSDAEYDEEVGKMCVLKEEEIDTITKKPIMECTHK